jgi:ferredoxin-NADP reductase/Na+-translocating ferredoxin:NAD+ oxidoreductase RnfD subunit
MYWLVLYFLIVLIGFAEILAFFHKLAFGPWTLFFSTTLILAVCWILNKIFSWTFKVPANKESVYITGLILALIITPAQNYNQEYILYILWACIWAIACKFLLTIKRKHIFNPAAFGVAITALALNHGASWWVGSGSMLILVLLGGILVVRKIKRAKLVFSFLLTATLTFAVFTFVNRGDLIHSIKILFVDTPFFFFAFIMLTEPLTTPPTNLLQIYYGGLVGLLYAPQIHIGSVYSTPELALLIGNLFSYLVSPKVNLLLILKHKHKVADSIYEFVFKSEDRLNFKPGQYMEWTYGHKNPDSRGNRRYFTIASSPTEKEMMFGIKFYNPASSFKSNLLHLHPGSKIFAGALAGDFVLPDRSEEKLAFIAGGVGITPFRSMFKYLIDTKQARDIALFYSNTTADEIAYQDILSQAQREIGAKIFLTLTDQSRLPMNWANYTGYVDSAMVMDSLPDYQSRTFYISGSDGFVSSMKKTLRQIGVAGHKIKTDFFPGFI